MKKMLITLLIAVFFITGCNIIKVSDRSINDIFETILYVDNDLSNTYMNGYKFYLPQGVTIVDKNDYNLKVKDNDGYYYLYIDTVAYHYKTDNTYTVNDSHFFSQKITHNGINGYIDIKEVEDYYFIVLMYNYAKIESFVLKPELNSTLTNMCYILSTIKFNDSVIDEYIDEKGYVFKEESFDIFSSKSENDNFLTYKEEYGTYKGEIEVEDNETLDIETLE